MTEPLDPLTDALLRTLAAEPPGKPMSLPRLVKRLDLGASALLRQLTLMSDATLGGMPGPGWVQVEQHQGGWRASLTEQGRIYAESLLIS